jgi:glycosyltransferase involved in cell wall biosynthesis
MGGPLVSIITPCYKQAHFLGEAIESALNQTYPNREVIVIDDGSPDETFEVASSYPEVRVIRQRNQGLSAARNAGIHASQGEYLIFLDSDDRLRPNAIEAGLACMREEPEAAIVWGRHHCIREDGSLYPSPAEPRLYEGDLYPVLLRWNIIGMISTVLWRKDVFKEVGGFNQSISPTADYDLYLKVTSKRPSHKHQEVVAEYRIYGASMSQDPAVMLRGVIISLTSQWKNVKGRADYEEAYRAGMKFWREWYGDPLYLRVAKRLSDPRGLGDNLRDLWYLARYYPQSIWQHGINRLSKLTAKLR